MMLSIPLTIVQNVLENIEISNPLEKVCSYRKRSTIVISSLLEITSFTQTFTDITSYAGDSIMFVLSSFYNHIITKIPRY